MKKSTLPDPFSPIHPGEVLRDEFLQPMGITQYRLAADLGVDQMRVSEIVRGKRAITADTALRLSQYFGNSVDFWMNLQSHFDVRSTRTQIERDLAAIRPHAV